MLRNRPPARSLWHVPCIDQGMDLRITIDHSADALKLKLDGRLAGPWVEELRRAWDESVRRSPSRPVLVDVCDVVYSDSDGIAVLKHICSTSQAQVRSNSPWTNHLASTIQSAKRTKC